MSTRISPALLAAVTCAAPAAAQLTGPSSSRAPYVLPVAGGVVTRSLLSVGDAVAPGQGQTGPYRMVGIPDGLGAFSSGDGTLTLFSNHELTPTAGAIRAHGSRGAFVAQWRINAATGQVLSGRDLIRTVYLWDPATGQYAPGTAAFNRFCSADLPAPSALFNPATGRGASARIYLNGEESDAGRAFASLASGPHAGQTWELPRLGKFAFENVVACPFPQDKTIVFCMDDGNLATAPTGFPSDLCFYIGMKTATGAQVDRAGLTNGNLFGVRITVNGQPVPEESNAFGLGSSQYTAQGQFQSIDLGDVSAMTAGQVQAHIIANNISRLQRIEDGAWDPRPGHQNEFYFVTTASFTSNSRLWKLTFDDITHPELGGQIEILLRGDEGHHMLDNIGFDAVGNILMQEDPGNVDHIAKLWQYNTRTGALTLIAQHSPALFDPNYLGAGQPGPNFLTRDEESSGIFDARDTLGPGWLLLDVQAHYSVSDPELVQGGQLIALFNPDSYSACPADFNNDGVANGLDVAAFQHAMKAGRPEADFDRSGIINHADFRAFMDAWRQGCN